MTTSATSPHVPARPGMRPERPGRADIALAAGYAAVFLGGTLLLLRSKTLYLPLFGGQGLGSVPLDLRLEVLSFASMALVAASAVALAWRRARPRASFLAICAIGCVQVVLGEPIAYWNVAMPIALFSAAAYADRGFARQALGIAALAYVGLLLLGTDLLGRLGSLRSLLDLSTTFRGAAAFAGFALLLVIWVAGDQVRAARERTELRFERAAQQDREREADARIGAMAERHRIARELHDVVAHGLAVMIVQADGALYAEAEHPEAPRQALATIAATGRESLTEMRHLLGVLRDDPDAAQLAPQPGVDAIPGLIERFREAGLTVEHQVEGTPRAVSPAVGLTAYRVVQESLTNVLHHAGATGVKVLFRFLPYGVGIVVVNQKGDRPVQPAGEREGLGLLGMQERVGLLGGRMAAGPTSDGGFSVEVEIPEGIRWPTAPLTSPVRASDVPSRVGDEPAPAGPAPAAPPPAAPAASAPAVSATGVPATGRTGEPL